MRNVFSGLPPVSRTAPWLPWLFSLWLFMGCSEDPQQLFETAQFEEQQRNFPHAQELYERIIREHPTSSLAEKARERIDALRKEQP